jgi:hypothetical protein
MAKLPPPTKDQLSIGTLIVVRDRPRVPVHVLEVVEYPGAMSGFLVMHDGYGVGIVDGNDVRLFQRSAL